MIPLIKCLEKYFSLIACEFCVDFHPTSHSGWSISDCPDITSNKALETLEKKKILKIDMTGYNTIKRFSNECV